MCTAVRMFCPLSGRFCNRTDPATIMTDYSNGALPVIHSNKIYNIAGSANVTCGYYGPPSLTDTSLEKFLHVGLMQGTTVSPLPTDEEVVRWGKGVLGMATV